MIREANALKRPAVITTNPFLPTYASTNPFHNINILNNNENDLGLGDMLQTIIIPEPEPQPEPEPSVVKLDEIDLLANIKNRPGAQCDDVDREQCQQQPRQLQQVGSVPDVVELSHAQEKIRLEDNDNHDAEDYKEEQVVPVTPVDEKKEKMLRNQARKRQQQIRQDNKRRTEIEAGEFSRDFRVVRCLNNTSSVRGSTK